MRARDLFYGLWVPDAFMQAVKEDKDWYLMCPDKCEGLSDSYGETFERIYMAYVKEGKFTRKMKAREHGLRFLMLKWKQAHHISIKTLQIKR